MVKLQRQRDKIVEALTGINDHVEMNRLGAELAAAQAALSEAEETWLALAEDAETIRSRSEGSSARSPGLSSRLNWAAIGMGWSNRRFSEATLSP